MNIRIHPSWKALLKNEFTSTYFETLVEFVRNEYRQHECYPPSKQIFEAFDQCPVDNVRVVILGQDPYHTPGMANGLCFSVNDGMRLPPSLRNIFKEIEQDLGFLQPTTGNLQPWAKQGVFLLNATLTVRKHQAGAHQNRGWEVFTDAVIKQLSSQKKNLVFMLWGAYARAKKELINTKNHHMILEAAHPSPFSAHHGFFGCRHFSRANAFLKQKELEEIRWCI